MFMITSQVVFELMKTLLCLAVIFESFEPDGMGVQLDNVLARIRGNLRPALSPSLIIAGCALLSHEESAICQRG